VEKLVQTIAFESVANKVFGDAPITLNGLASSGLPVVYSLIYGPARLSGNSLTLLGAGEVRVRASQPGNDEIKPAPEVDEIVNVAKASQTITSKPLQDTYFNSETRILSAWASSGLPVSFAVVSGPAAVVENTLKLTGTGLVTWRAIQTGNSNYNAAPAIEQTFTVNKAVPSITWANPADIAYGVVLGASHLNATASVPGSFVYNPPAGTKLNAGTGQTLGVVFTPTDTANYQNATASVTINVANPTLVITWSNPADIVYGMALGASQLNATASVPGSFVYNPPAGTKLNAGANQTLGVVFISTDTANYQNATASVTISVAKAAPTITWANPAEIAYGVVLGSNQLNASASVPGSFVYNPPAGTTLNARANQALGVVFIPTDTANYQNETASVTISVAKAAPAITWANPAEIAYGVVLGSSQLNATASVPGSFVYSPPAGTTLNARANQALGVVFIPTDTANYQNATASVTINVAKAAPAITWANPAEIAYGVVLGSSELNATASVPGSFVYNPPAGTKLNAGAGQALGVVFTPTDTANYQNATASVTINVAKAVPSITWSNPADIAYGTMLGASQLNATASVPGSFVYNPPAGTTLNAGANQTLGVVFIPTDMANHQITTASVTINLAKATPTLTWANPADMVSGTVLGAGQLNATASVPGNFVYSPPAGTILNTGSNQALTVSFSPSDAVNFNSSTAVVRVNVLPKPQTFSIGRPRFLPGGIFTFQLRGSPNVSYRLEISTNLMDWVPQLTLQAPDGVVDWIDPDLKPRPRKYYRAVAQ
jgi:hypothetical protein